MTETPDITVVVCTHNRADMLRDALESLSRLHLPEELSAEILVVDNASEDNTPQIVRQVAGHSPIPIRYVFEPRPGIVPARNRGVNEARGEWIAFFDDDQLAEENWLQELYAEAVACDVKVAGGAVRLKLPAGCRRNLSPVCRMLLGETVGRPASCDYDYRFTPGTGNLMLHRSVLEHIGLFDPRVGQRGEDTDLFLRAVAAGYRGRYTPRAVIHHVIPPERLTDAFLVKLSRLMAEGMAEDEFRARGRWLYPFFWLARVAQLGLVLFPRWLWAVLTRNAEMQLGMRCRLIIARAVLREGWRLIISSFRRNRLEPCARPNHGDKTHPGNETNRKSQESGDQTTYSVTSGMDLKASCAVETVPLARSYAGWQKEQHEKR